MAPDCAASMIPFSIAGRNCCGTAPPKILSSKTKPPPRGKRFKDNLAIAKLSATAGLFLVTALNLGALRNGFLVRNLRRMQRHFDAVTLLQFLDDRFDVKLTRTGKQKLLCLRVAREVKRLIFFQNLVQRDADLLFVLTRLRLDRKSDRRFGIFNRVVNDRRLLVAERVAGLRLFQFYAGDDVAGVGFGNLVELLTLDRMQQRRGVPSFRGLN